MTDIIPHKQFSFDNIKSVTYHITPQYSMPVSDFSVPFYWSTPYPPPTPTDIETRVRKVNQFSKSIHQEPSSSVCANSNSPDTIKNVQLIAYLINILHTIPFRSSDWDIVYQILKSPCWLQPEHWSWSWPSQGVKTVTSVEQVYNRTIQSTPPHPPQCIPTLPSWYNLGFTR